MKRLLFVFALAIMFTFIACEKDPGPEPNPNPNPTTYKAAIKVGFNAAPSGMVVSVTNFGLQDQNKVDLTMNFAHLVPSPVADFTWDLDTTLARQQWGKTVYVYVGACRSDGVVCYGQEEWLKIDKLGKTNEVQFVIRPF